MKLLLTIISILLFGCQSWILSEETVLSDDELIESIQNSSNKEAIDIDQLPAESMEILQQSYYDKVILNSMLAPEFGYEISLGMTEAGMGDIAEIYFAIEGRELRSEREDYDQNRECFNLVYPLTFSMPDGTDIIVDHEDDWDEVREWYEQNPDATERYSQYPVDIIYGNDPWLGDGYCDSGQYGYFDDNGNFHFIHFNCEEYNWDEGDCASRNSQINPLGKYPYERILIK